MSESGDDRPRAAGGSAADGLEGWTPQALPEAPDVAGALLEDPLDEPAEDPSDEAEPEPPELEVPDPEDEAEPPAPDVLVLLLFPLAPDVLPFRESVR